MKNARLAHHAVATIRQATSRRYPKLEALIETMDAEQLQELVRLLNDTQDEAKRRVRSRANRMGLGHLIR